MDENEKSLLGYKEQLRQVEFALLTIEEGEDKNNLLTLQSDIKQLIALTEETITPSSNSTQNEIEDEYALFMSEMAKEGAVESTSSTNENVQEDLKTLEGMKCRAPHQHTWGDTVYHNALISSVIPMNGNNFNDIEVKVLFTNPTHKEMLPCPYLLESECKFSDEKCRYSHGEIVLFSKLEEYVEPNYQDLAIGSLVLAKSGDKLWYRATVKRLFNEKCMVKFDSNSKDLEVEFCNVHPLNEKCTSDSESDDEVEDQEDVINMSLMITPASDKLGEWEKFTKGIGSKLMEKMGYIVGSGLGKRADGRLDPVPAVVLPAGKSLDHCMDLREKSGGDKNLFSVEKKLKRLQKKQELRNQKNYERESKKVDVFNFLNNTLSEAKNKTCIKSLKQEHRMEIRKETCRNLNVESLKIEEAMKNIDRELFKIHESLNRHQDANSQVHRELKKKLMLKQQELNLLKGKAVNINNEKSLRNDKKKMTIF